LVIALAVVVILSPARARGELLHFTVDPSGSEISATVSEPMSSLRGSATGKFRVVSGEVSSDSASPARTTSVKLVIDAASYSSGWSRRDRSVTGSILQAETYPQIVFKGGDVDNIVHTGDTSGTATIRGNLTLHGVARAIIVPLEVRLISRTRVETDGEVSLSYPDWGIEVPTLLFGSMRAGNQATIRFHIVAVTPSF
jgi:polyisoprenoid-binding protein YceI